MRAVTVGSWLVATLLFSACATTPAVQAGVKVRPETRPECAAHCETLGMRLGAVVLIRNSAGCVCEPREAPPPPGASAPAEAPRAAAEGGGAAIAGGALMAIEEEERREHEEHDYRPTSP